jgi:hypothetical protein
MSPRIERNPAQFFTIVGAAYIPESHGDIDGNCFKALAAQRYGMGLSWLVRDLNLPNIRANEWIDF